MSFGYACINMQLNYPQKYGGKPRGTKPVMTGRRMIKRTFEQKGLNYASEITLLNCIDLVKIIDWNILNDFDFYRMTSGIAPWKTEYNWNQLKDFENIKSNLETAGQKARENNIRITAHPGPFNVLTSPHEHVVNNTIKDLIEHADIFDMMGLSNTTYNKINIHLGGAYGDKEKSMERFCKNFELLPDNVKCRLTVENDDKASMYSVHDLYSGIYSRIGIPIVFDYHHHRFCTGGFNECEALQMSVETWKDIKPVVHYSETRVDSNKPQAHSDYVENYIDTYGYDVDIMVEAKMKELAVQKYKELHNDR